MQKKELCILYIILVVLLFFLVNISEVIIEYDRVFFRRNYGKLERITV